MNHKSKLLAVHEWIQTMNPKQLLLPAAKPKTFKQYAHGYVGSRGHLWGCLEAVVAIEAVKNAQSI